MARKRRTEAFSMSFLDCMCCGFGAVILFFMIINATVAIQSDAENSELMSETDMIDEEVLEGRKNLVKLRNVLESVEEERIRTDGESARILEQIEEIKEKLAEFDGDSLARKESIEQLRSDIETLEKERERLLAAAAEEENPGNNVRSFVGTGDRQYLTGLKIGGTHSLILVDRSASMLARELVNILRRRNLPEEQKLSSAKWRQVVASVDWISSQMRPDTQFQIYMFNETTEPVVEGTEGVWLDVGEGNTLGEAVRTLRKTPPEGGTNLQEALRTISNMVPRPDTVFVLTDSLPTQGDRRSKGGFVTGPERLRLFREAVREVPSGIPINVLLYPMEGDYNAPVEFWMLAYNSGGSFMSVSKDWP
ncbi:MAG: VWA domain-containing protein [Pseudomonadota bacterium]